MPSAAESCSSARVRRHSHARPDAHCTQRRQGANHDSTTLSPTATSRTSGPIASTTPAPS